jgi:hypothetical protein
MDRDRQSFVFYGSYDEAIRMLETPEQRDLLYRAISDFGLRGIYPEDTGDKLVDMALKFVRPLIDANLERKERARENGKFGGAPKGNQNAKKTTQNNQNQPKTTKNKLNVNVNDNSNNNANTNANINVNENVNVNKNVNIKEPNPYVDINTQMITDFEKYDEWNRAHGIVED